MMETRNRKRLDTVHAGALALILFMGTTTVIFSQGQSSGHANSKNYVATEKIIKDQHTGELRLPTVEETEDLVNNLLQLTNRSEQGLQPVSGPENTQKLDLQGRFQHVLISRPNVDGTMQIRCVNSMEEAALFLGLRVQANNGAEK